MAVVPLIIWKKPETFFYSKKIKNLFGSSLIDYRQLNELSGSNAFDSSPKQHPAGNAVGVTWGDIQGPPLTKTKAPFLDGANDYVNIYSAALSADFNGAAGSVLLWGRVANSGVWTDAVARVLASFKVDAQNEVNLQKTSGANTLAAFYRAGNVLETVTKTDATSINWFQWAITWNKAAEEMKAFYNGIQQGTTQTALGVWAGSLSSSLTVLGAGSTVPANVWNGWLAHALLLNRAATPAEIAKVYDWGV